MQEAARGFMSINLSSQSISTLHHTLIATAHKVGHLQHMVSALISTGLSSTLKGTGPFTLFAPNDEAFSKLDADVLEDLLSPQSRPRLRRVLKLHIVLGRIRYQATGAQAFAFKSMQGQDLSITYTPNFKVNQAQVLQADLPASNGLIHVIDSVLAVYC
jgi:uncharacterized surface protein with fasciclin (FAS1) repeats